MLISQGEGGETSSIRWTDRWCIFGLTDRQMDGCTFLCLLILIPKYLALSFLAIWYLIGPTSVLSGKRGGEGFADRVVNNNGCWRDQHWPRSSSSFIITGHHFPTERRVKGLITYAGTTLCWHVKCRLTPIGRVTALPAGSTGSEDICLAHIDCDKQLSNHLPRFILRGLSLVVST